MHLGRPENLCNTSAGFFIDFLLPLSTMVSEHHCSAQSYSTCHQGCTWTPVPSRSLECHTQLTAISGRLRSLLLPCLLVFFGYWMVSQCIWKFTVRTFCHPSVPNPLLRLRFSAEKQLKQTDSFAFLLCPEKLEVALNWAEVDNVQNNVTSPKQSRILQTWKHGIEWIKKQAFYQQSSFSERLPFLPSHGNFKQFWPCAFWIREAHSAAIKEGV